VTSSDPDARNTTDPPRGNGLVFVLQTGFSFGLALASLSLAIVVLVGAREPFAAVGLNQLAPGARIGAMVAVAASFVVGLSIALVGLRRAGALRPRLERARRFAMPLMLSALVPGLFVRPLWHRRELAFLVMVGAVGLTLERLLRAPIAMVLERGASSKRLPAKLWNNAALRTWLPRVLLALLIGWYFVEISRGTLLCHARMASDSSDLAEFDNLFFNALHGHPFRAPAIDGAVRDWSALKIHTEFLLYLLVPFYALRPSAEGLLVIQTAIVAGTALPIYLFAARRLGRTSGLVFALVFLLWPAVQRPNFFDFHFTPIGMFFVAWVVHCLDRVVAAEPGRSRRRALLALGAVFALALLSREDVAIGLVLFGLVVAVLGFAPRLGLGMALSATLYVIFVLWLKQHQGKTAFYLMYAQLQVPGQEGTASVVKTLVTNPMFVLTRLMTEVKLTYLAFMMVPLSFLWVRRWYLVLALLPGALLTLLVTDRVMLNEISFQYSYLWVPYLVAASVLGLEQLGRGAEGRPRRLAALAALVFVAGATSFHYGALLGASSIRGGPVEKALRISPAERRRLADLNSIARLIPPDASVAATDHEGPHVSNRLTFYSLKTTLGDKPDYVLYGSNVSVRLERTHVQRALASGEYGLAAERGEFRLLHRGAPTDKNGELLRALESSR